MKIEGKLFKAAVDEAAVFVNPKSSIPILTHVRVGEGEIVGTDLSWSRGYARNPAKPCPQPG